MRITNQSERYISYRLNILGLRVCKDCCHLVAKDRSGEWVPLGGTRPIPVDIPRDPAAIGQDTLLLTAHQFDVESPGSDLRAVLSGEKSFDQALQDT